MEDAERTHPSFVRQLRDPQADQVAWPEFHRRYGHMLYRYARAIGAHHADAEDAVQDVELQLYRAIGNFDYDARRGRFRAYLRTAVLHALGRRANRRAHQPAELEPWRLETLASEEQARRDETWQQEWQLHRLRQAVQDIAGEFEDAVLKAFEMFVLAGCTADETARALDISKWSVYRASNRVLDRLREQLKQVERAEEG